MIGQESFVILYLYFFLLMLGLFVASAIAALVFLAFRKKGITRSNIKGNVGEWQVANILKGLDPNQFIVLNNIMLEREVWSKEFHKTITKTAQIDHIIVSIYGIFVVETKNYTGQIYGSADALNWNQYLHGKRNSFYNPIWQNRGHIRAIQQLLNKNNVLWHSDNIYPIVAFSGNAVLFVQAPGYDVTYYGNLVQVIGGHCKEPVMTKEEVENIANFILKNNLDSEERRREHIQNICRVAK